MTYEDKNSSAIIGVFSALITRLILVNDERTEVAKTILQSIRNDAKNTPEIIDVAKFIEKHIDDTRKLEKEKER